MNNNQDVVVSFEGVPTADQNTLAEELSEKLLTEARRQAQADVNQQAICAEVYKADANTMDLGNLIDITLVIEHLPPAIVAHLIYEFFLNFSSMVLDSPAN